MLPWRARTALVLTPPGMIPPLNLRKRIRRSRVRPWELRGPAPPPALSRRWRSERDHLLAREGRALPRNPRGRQGLHFDRPACRPFPPPANTGEPQGGPTEHITRRAGP